MRSALPILAIAGAFLAFSAATLDDYGLTWDEGVKMFDDAHYADILRRTEPYDPRVLHIPGYFYVADTLRSLYAKAISDALPRAHPVLVHHSFNVLLSSACLVLLYGLVLAVSGARRLAATSAIALALMPQFLGHSQNNPKDLPAAVLFLAVAWAFVAASRRPRVSSVAAGAVLFGVALTTRVSAVLLAPILGGWLLLRRREDAVRSWRWIVAAAVGAVIAALASFPALLARGLEVFEVTAQRFAVLQRLDVKVLYLGELHPWVDLPWHFSLVHALATLTPAHLTFLLAAVPALLHWRGADRAKSDALWLALLWVGVLFGADLFAPLHYDGVRHLLAALPALALLIACGVERGFEWLESARERRGLPRWTSSVVAVALAAIPCVELAQIHPYQTAYLNPVARWIAGPRAEEWIEVEYWGASYKEGSEWINRNAPPDAIVHFVIGGGQRTGEDVARYYLERPTLRGGSLEVFANEETPQYLMFITRRAWYDDFVRDVRARYTPVHTVRRQDATLLEIYFNREGKRP